MPRWGTDSFFILGTHFWIWLCPSLTRNTSATFSWNIASFPYYFFSYWNFFRYYVRSSIPNSVSLKVYFSSFFLSFLLQDKFTFLFKSFIPPLTVSADYSIFFNDYIFYFSKLYWIPFQIFWSTLCFHFIILSFLSFKHLFYGLYITTGLPWWLSDKEIPCQYRRHWLISWWGRSSGEGNGNLFHYSCLENLMDRGAWQATVHVLQKTQAWLSA